MAKAISNSSKLNFGTRKGGKAKKSRGPKDKQVSKYKGQGN